MALTAARSSAAVIAPLFAVVGASLVVCVSCAVSSSSSGGLLCSEVGSGVFDDKNKFKLS